MNKTKKNYTMTIISFLFIALAFVYLIWQPIKLVRVSGDSMSPTLKNAQLILMHKKEIKRNDIVTFTPPKEWGLEKNVKFIKRVIGVPGDKITIKNSQLFVNGLLHTDFSNISPTVRELDLELVKDTYFLMGDNLGNSFDSLTQFVLWQDNFTVKKEFIQYGVGGIPYEK